MQVVVIGLFGYWGLRGNWLFGSELCGHLVVGLFEWLWGDVIVACAGPARGRMVLPKQD